MIHGLLILILCLAAASSWAHAETATYVNSRFAYQVDYPAEMLTPQGESRNGDGQRWISRDRKFIVTVWGIHNALGNTLAEECDQRIAWEKTRHPFEATHQTVKSTWFAYSGRSGDTIVHEKTLLTGDVFQTVRLEFPAADKTAWDGLVKRIVDSFRSLKDA